MIPVGSGPSSGARRGCACCRGPNGAGKTSILDALRFLQTAAERGVAEAVRLAGGGALLRRLGAEPKAPVRLGLTLGELSWEIQLPVEGGSIHPNHGELLKRGDMIFGERAMYAAFVFLGRMPIGMTEWNNPLNQPVTARIFVGPGRPNEAYENYTIPARGSAFIPTMYDAVIPGSAPHLVRAENLWPTDSRSILKMLMDTRRPSDLPAEVAMMLDLVRGIRVYSAYRLDQIRKPAIGGGDRSPASRQRQERMERASQLEVRTAEVQ